VNQSEHKTVTVHRLKTWTGFFDSVVQGFKPFEIRLDDRGFKLNDILLLMEYHPVRKRLLGRSCAFRVSYVLRLKDFPDAKGWRWKLARAIMPNLVVMGIYPLEVADGQAKVNQTEGEKWL